MIKPKITRLWESYLWQTFGRLHFPMYRSGRHAHTFPRKSSNIDLNLEIPHNRTIGCNVGDNEDAQVRSAFCTRSLANWVQFRSALRETEQILSFNVKCLLKATWLNYLVACVCGIIHRTHWAVNKRNPLTDWLQSLKERFKASNPFISRLRVLALHNISNLITIFINVFSLTILCHSKCANQALRHFCYEKVDVVVVYYRLESSNTFRQYFWSKKKKRRRY